MKTSVLLKGVGQRSFFTWYWRNVSIRWNTRCNSCSFVLRLAKAERYLCSRNSAHNYNCYCNMTKEEFKDLQLDMQQSGMSVTKYLQHVGINYNTYNNVRNWRRMIPQSRNSPPSVSPNMQILCFPVLYLLVRLSYSPTVFVPTLVAVRKAYFWNC